MPLLRRQPPVEGESRLRAFLGGGAVPAAVPAVPDAAVPDAPGAVGTPRSGVLLDPSRRGLAALGALGVAAAAVAGLLVWRSRPVPVAVAPPVVVSAETAPELVVDVAGAVRRPGLIRLPAGSRVADAVAAAGGPLPGATTAGLNLARRVADGEQIVVLPPGATPPAGAGGGGAPGGAAGGRLDLNLATVEQLDALPGVGPVLAQRIVDWRERHGRFASVEQLAEVPGIGEKKFESLRDLVTA